MKTQTLLPLISSPEIPPLGPSCGPCPKEVDDGSGELREVRAAEPEAKPVATREILGQAHGIQMGVMCPTGEATGAQPPADLTDRFVWAVRITVQMILLYLRTPPTIKSMGHTAGADTRLVPAIDHIIKYAGAIEETDSRIFRKVNLKQLIQQRATLLFLREIRKIFVVAADCVDAGITHVEQYLDASARYVYSKLTTDIGGDLLLQQDLQGLIDLVSVSIATGQETRKSNLRAAMQASADADTAPGAAGSAVAPGQGILVSVMPPAPAVVPAASATFEKGTGRAAMPSPARGGSRRKG